MKDHVGQTHLGMNVKLLEGYGAPTVRIEIDGIAQIWTAQVKETYGKDTWWEWKRL